MFVVEMQQLLQWQLRELIQFLEKSRNLFKILPEKLTKTPGSTVVKIKIRHVKGNEWTLVPPYIFLFQNLHNIMEEEVKVVETEAVEEAPVEEAVEEVAAEEVVEEAAEEVVEEAAEEEAPAEEVEVA